jgi:hypothetical protein
MLRKITVALAIAFVLESATLSTGAFASDDDLGGRAEGSRGDYVTHSMGRGRTADHDPAYSRRARNWSDRFGAYAPRDVWGHWGTYYGPMVHAP